MMIGLEGMMGDGIGEKGEGRGGEGDVDLLGGKRWCFEEAREGRE